MATAKKEDLQDFLDACESLEERGFSEHGVAHAVGFNNTAAYKGFQGDRRKEPRNYGKGE